MLYITKGQTTTLRHTIYSYWSGQESSSIKANLAGASVNVYFKQRLTDADASAVLNKAGTVTDAVNGVADTALAASDTNAWSYSKLFMETVAKLSDGTTYIRQIEEVEIDPNLKKTLP